ncbi:MerR family transcriptional regulator [Photobacterium sp. SDRW27]|uniref:MerR family transcriptional regulator n=1 Tax=Photobacterium obscurum TaxID=2829490 RepID=UPI002243A060|nr:MerR family transcriptional regulator [Photobacterium obscurum]MCW8330144.1 MerR family transcriptional regulator [Photobacterium obscurum]
MRIHEAAEVSGLSCHTLRFYEKSGLIYPIPRDASGHRFYREHDIRWLHFVQCLKSTGMPLKDIQRFAAKVGDAENQAELLLKILQQHKVRLEQKLEETKEFLNHIDWKIEHYQAIITEQTLC